MPQIRVPTTADTQVQDAFRDTEAWLRALDAKSRTVGLTSAERRNIQRIKDDVEALKKSPEQIEENREATFASLVTFLEDVTFAGEVSFTGDPDGAGDPPDNNDDHVLHGDGSWAYPLRGLVRTMRHEEDHKDIVNVHGGLHVLDDLQAGEASLSLVSTPEIVTPKISSAGYIEKNENSHFIDLPLRAPDGRIVTVEDDFIHAGPLVSGDIGSLNWNIAGQTGYSTAYGAGNINHSGLFRMTPDNDTGDAVYLFGNYTVYPMPRGISEYWQTWIIHDGQTAANIGKVNIIVGINSTVDYAAGTDGIYFFIDYNNNNNWVARTIASSTATDTDTGVTHISGNTGSGNYWWKFDIHYTPTEVKFYINESLVATHTTNIPNQDTANMQPAFAAECDATGNGGSLNPVYIDYYALTWKYEEARYGVAS